MEQKEDIIKGQLFDLIQIPEDRIDLFNGTERGQYQGSWKPLIGSCCHIFFRSQEVTQVLPV